MSGSRRRRQLVGHDSEDRWLLTYADMITLLMALFMVLFSISSVNISKYQTLQQSLKAAFNGSPLPGGISIATTGSAAQANQAPQTSEFQTIIPPTPTLGTPKGTASVQGEQSNLAALEHQLNSYAAAHGFAKQIQVALNPQGLQVTVLTDQLLFASGEATVNPAATPLLDEITNLVHQTTSPVLVSGYTDSVPTDSALYPSNWELSSARASAVVRFLIERGITPTRLTAQGFAALYPIASNATEAGRALNRRVVIEIERQGASNTTQTAAGGS
jgi:chemotaxis protein MotB